MDERIINSLKGLSIDMIDNVKSGHPGIALGAAPIIYTLYSKHLNISLDNDKWMNRDRFILSSGHASALLYSMLYYVGYLTLDDLKEFRVLNSKTPGHPEITTKGVDMSTGPLGQGIGNAVGCAISEVYLSKLLGDDYINHYTYVMCGDGDLEEGISYEAMSLAGTLKLNKLIVLYDSNDVSLDGKTSLTFNEDIEMRFKSINWNYIKVNNGESVEEIDKAIISAKSSDRPTIIEIKTIIGKGSMLEGTNKVHGSPLSSEDIAKLKDKLGLSQEPFFVDKELVKEFRDSLKMRLPRYDVMKSDFIDERLSRKVDLLSVMSPYYEDINESLRETNGKIMNEISNYMATIIGGAADLSSSTKTYLDGKGIFSKDDHSGRNIYYGVREHAMGAISNGIASNKLLPFASTFLCFSDYLKPSIRMSALMNLPVTYIFTHDSINVGCDGATHEPIEQLSMLRSIPNLRVFRPADANEILGCWNMIINEPKPSAIVLSRNVSPLLEESDPRKVDKGAYIVHKENNRLKGILIATGTEVSVACKVAEELSKDGIALRVISMPSIDVFEKQSDEYKSSILPAGYKTISIEYSNYDFGKFTKYNLGMREFGRSGSATDVVKYFDLDYDSIKEYIKRNI